MITENTITTLKRDLIRAFAVLDGWFDKDEAFHHYKPPGGHYPAHHLLQHAMLTSRQLTTVIDHGGSQLSVKTVKALDGYQMEKFTLDHTLINVYFENTQKSFQVNEMLASFDLLRRELRDNLHRCLCHLDLLQNGEGALYKTAFFDNHGEHTVDLYQCLQVMVLCLKKYVEQLSAIEDEYRTQSA